MAGLVGGAPRNTYRGPVAILYRDCGVELIGTSILGYLILGNLPDAPAWIVAGIIMPPASISPSANAVSLSC